jgi:SAM-dependent methyltransferase
MTRLQIADLIARAGHRHVLDVPCFQGRFTQMLLDRGLEVVSADINTQQFLVPDRTSIWADLNSGLPFKDEEFDAVACIEGVEHIENPHLLAREVNRVLQPGGKFYVSTPNILSIRSRLSYLLRGYQNYFHYMIEIDPATGREGQLDHINPIGFLELRYVLSRWGFRIDLILTNRYQKRWSPFYQFFRLLMLTKGRRSAAKHPEVAAVRRTLLSDTVLFGEALILVATKIRDYREGLRGG